MIVVLDTNALFTDLTARKGPVSVLIDEAAKGRIELVLPEVVVQELVKRARVRIEQALKSRAQALKQLAEIDITAFEPDSLNLAEILHAYELALRATFGGPGARVQPTPDLGRIVPWSVNRRKPLRRRGRACRTRSSG